VRARDRSALPHTAAGAPLLEQLWPGRRAAAVAWTAVYGGTALGTLCGATWGLLRAEAELARRTIGTPKEKAPLATGSWGRGRPGTTPLRLAVLGDSSAAGLGCQRAEQTPGALLAGGLARELRRRVLLDVRAVIGAKSMDLDPQVARAMASGVDLAVVMIGANDVTHGTPSSAAARDLARAVATLRAAGAEVVVGTCPDLGTVKPLWQPLRAAATLISRRMASAQTVAVVEAGGAAVSLGDLLGVEFGESPHLWSADRFHPSAQGYARVVEVLLPAALAALGVEPPSGAESGRSVQDVGLAASVASRAPGLVVETVAGDQGAAAVGPGRLAWLRRRVPLEGQPEGRTPSEREAAAAEAAGEEAAGTAAGSTAAGGWTERRSVES